MASPAKSSVVEKPATLLINLESASIPKEGEFQKSLESKDDQVKIEAMKKIIVHMLNGESFPKLLMTVIKFCIHTENHTLKKLLLLYWEVVDKKDSKGSLLHEMILVCQAMKNNLNHPNEYIRGNTLRFLTKLKEPEILDSLVPAITANLTHRHSYVRKYAVLAVMNIYQALPDLIRDAPELVEKFLADETNPLAKKNGFLMLFQCDQPRAVKYLNTVLDNIANQSEAFQLVALELIRKVCRENPLQKSQYIRSIYTMVNSTSHAVAFEGANTLVALSTAPTAVRAAVTAYCQLLSSESDNNVKLIILNRLSQLKKRNQKIITEMLMDILRTLSSPSLDIRKKTLELVSDLVSQRNVEQVVQVLKKELTKTEGPDQQDNPEEFRKLITETFRQCAALFPEVIPSIDKLLINFVCVDVGGGTSALQIAFFLRDSVQEYPQYRAGILSKLMESFDEIRLEQIYRVILWVLGEYCTDAATLEQALITIRKSIGPLPLLPPDESEIELPQSTPIGDSKQSNYHEAKDSKEKEKEKKLDKKSTTPKLLADGSYATQSQASDKKSAVGESEQKPLTKGGLRARLIQGNYYLASVLAITLTKLTLRYAQAAGQGPEANEEKARTLQLLTNLIRLGEETKHPKKIDKDCRLRLQLCIRILASPAQSPLCDHFFSQPNKELFAEMLTEVKQKELSKKSEKKTTDPIKQVNEIISIRQLSGRLSDDNDLDDMDDITRALGSSLPRQTARLNRVYQLTGFGDPVYAEARLTILEYDILLDLLLVNQTNKTLQSLTVELHTSGDLKVMDRPQSYTLSPNASQRIRTTVKVTSTDSGAYVGIIFGNIVYDSSSGVEKTIVVLSNIHMDVIDYIIPAECDDIKYRHMWAEFEWENKVAVNTDITSLDKYLEHLCRITNMKCQTLNVQQISASGFLAANLYAKTMFGEDALLNVSVEKSPDTGKVIGFIRIRSKTQGIALSLGDKITTKQRVVDYR